MEAVLAIDALPLFVEAAAQAQNPGGLPDVFPFFLGVDREFFAIRQIASPELVSVLNRVYEYGSTVGNAMDELGAGRIYAEDFFGFIKEFTEGKPKVLEIGAGRGYLARVMGDAGLEVTALEPGKAQSSYWNRYGISVIPEMFPSRNAPGPYDLIVFYGVLEHMADAARFLDSVRDHLAPGGMALLSVPDCTTEIDTGDPSMLLHQHFYYFSRTSLVRVLAASGFRPLNVRASGFGRCLYACAMADNAAGAPAVEFAEVNSINAYAQRVTAAREQTARLVKERQVRDRSLGIYCPGRALSLLPQVNCYRFFDDAPEFWGRYFPPFRAVVENRQSLLDAPPDEVWIMSRTFGEKVKREILDLGFTKTVRTVEEIFIGKELSFPH